jgi:glycosyltransferase involved in cell wall biosynthesis
MKKTIAVSAINFFEGGPLSVLMDCLDYVNSVDFKNYKVVALIHKKEILDILKYPNIEFIEFPKSRTSYFYRLYYEYFYFKKIAKDYNVDFWLSLHDMTPNVGGIPQAVYCHNPSPFNSVNFSDLLVQPTQFFFSLFYKYLYKINIKKNKYVIVQQVWIKESFEKIFNLNPEKIIISKPQVPEVPLQYISNPQNNIKKLFFFPTFPRPFKNIEVIGHAVTVLSTLGIFNYEVIITIDGSENKYAEEIVRKFGGHPNIKFIGLISREQVYRYYDQIDCLIFPSKLETWGLPISEFKQFGKPMIVSDLPYAKETVSKYDKVCFFNPTNAADLVRQMRKQIEEVAVVYDETNFINYPDPIVNSWAQLFSKLLN